MNNLPPVYSVTQLNRHIRQWLEQDVGEINVEGEISNLSQPASGHLYFTLKDATAQLRCVYFKNRHKPLESKNLANGQKHRACGRLSLYEGRGDYQLIVEKLTDAGVGDLFQQFEALKLKLAKEGWFAAARKKNIPQYPDCIGVITSLSAAALRDILTTLAGRFPVAKVIIYPSDVQGQQASSQLIQALQRANNEARAQVLILARGGGSLEDLWAFNQEQLVYAIAQSTLPVVTGIGHETDFTLADFVADYRAATPTAAAAAVTPHQDELLIYFKSIRERLIAAMIRFLREKRNAVQSSWQKITDPRRLIHTHWQTLDYLDKRLHNSLQQSMQKNHQDLQLLIIKLKAQHPQRLLAEAKDNLQRVVDLMLYVIRLLISQHRQRLAKNMATLHAVSPLATLDRGYALVTQDSHVITDINQVNQDKPINIRLAKGALQCNVCR